MPQARIHPNAAARQRAYRERLKQRPTPPASPAVFQGPFTVVSEDGQPLLKVSLSVVGPILHLFDGEGNVAVQIGGEPGQGSIGLAQPNGEPRWL